MARRLSARDEIAALDALDGVAASKEYRATVEAALPRGVKPSEQFWIDLEGAVNAFLLWEKRRHRRPPTEERKRWQRVDKHITALERELRILHQETPRTHSDPDWALRDLDALAPLRHRARVGIFAYANIAKGYRGRANTSREFLYSSIIDLWTGQLKQALRYSTSVEGEPSGPLIRFFDACVRPIMDKQAPTLNGIREIIDRTKRRYVGLKSKK